MRLRDKQQGAEQDVHRRNEALEAENRELRRALDRAGAYLARLEASADQDVLTGVLNDRAFERELQLMIAFARRYGEPGTLVRFDIQGLDGINQKYGLAAGDAVLVHVAETLKAHTRESDVRGRIDGDEFAILFQKARPSVVKTKAAELVAKVRDRPVQVGVAELTAPLRYGAYGIVGDETAEQALIGARQRMYGLEE